MVGLILITKIIKEQNDVHFQASVTASVIFLVIPNIINLSTFEELRVVGLILITKIIKEQNDVHFQASVTVLEFIGIHALQYISSTA